jgi:Xaa-Pro aminopeptidase
MTEGPGLSAAEPRIDDPHVIGDDDTPLATGMVLALEPGVYFPNRYGARVERMYVVTPGGGRELRAASDPPSEER